MLAATLLAVFFVPIFFVVVRRIFKGSERQRRIYAHEDESNGQAPAPQPDTGATP
jgi:multidrug efflux pump